MSLHIDLILIQTLALNNKAPINEAVYTQLFLKRKPLVCNGNNNFGLGLMSAHTQFPPQSLLVYIFEKSNAKVLLNLNGGINDLRGQRICLLK